MSRPNSIGVILLVVAAALTAGALAATPDLRAEYDKALKAFYAERYDEAESGFSTVYRLQPDAPFAADAAFKAGEAAFRHERWDAAVQHFSHYLRTYPFAAAAAEAKDRLAQAREKTGGDRPPLPLPAVQRAWPRPAVAWIDELPGRDAGEIERYLAGLARLGYNMMAAPAAHLATAPPLFAAEPSAAGAYFATTAAPVCFDRLAALVISAHKARLRFIALLPVRSLAAGLDEARTDRRWDARTHAAAADPLHVDLFAEGAVDRLASLAADLARLGPDAVWLTDLTFAPDEGFSPGALAEVRKALPDGANPTAIFAGMTADPAGRFKQGGPSPAYAAFCEARARRALEAAAAMIQAIRRVHPSCRLGVVTPVEPFADELAGLRDAALDLDGLRKLPFDDQVLLIDPRAYALARGLTRAAAYAAMTELSARLWRSAGRAERAVVAVRTQSFAGGRPLQSWEIAEWFGCLLAAGPFGAALAPPPAGQAVGPWLSAKPVEASEEK